MGAVDDAPGSYSTARASHASLASYSKFTSNVQQRMRNGNSLKYPVIFVFPVRQISVGTEAVLIQTLAEKEEKQTSLWGVTTNITSNGRPLLVQRPLITT